MSINEEWLAPGARAPVDCATTSALVTEILRLREKLNASEKRASYSLGRVIRLFIERDTYRRALDKADPKKAAELARQFTEIAFRQALDKADPKKAAELAKQFTEIA